MSNKINGPIADQLEKWESTNGYLSKEREAFAELAHTLNKIGEIINKGRFAIGPYWVQRYDWGVIIETKTRGPWSTQPELWIRWKADDIEFPEELYEVYEYLRNNLGTIMADLVVPIDERIAVQDERGWL